LQSDLIGAAALGIRNLLILTGDHPQAGDQPEAKPVFDLDSPQLIETAVAIRDRGELPSGRKVGGHADFFIGVADTPLDPPLHWAPVSLLHKIAAGAQFVQTQFCMDRNVACRYIKRLVEEGITERVLVLIGVAPLVSARAALWIRQHLPGSIISDVLIERLAQASDPRIEGRKICLELLHELAEIPGLAGVHLMGSRDSGIMADVIAAARSSTTRL
jgi:methylenetetrahydrofolate reductase (NADPH)